MKTILVCFALALVAGCGDNCKAPELDVDAALVGPDAGAVDGSGDRDRAFDLCKSVQRAALRIWRSCGLDDEAALARWKLIPGNPASCDEVTSVADLAAAERCFAELGAELGAPDCAAALGAVFPPADCRYQFGGTP